MRRISAYILLGLGVFLIALAALAALSGAAIWAVSPALTLVVAAGFGLVGLIGYAGPWGDLGRTSPPRLSPEPGSSREKPGARNRRPRRCG